MTQTLPLIWTLTLAFGLALLFGYIAERLNTPALVGYLVAGVACGSYTYGPVADIHLAHQLSELGVILLMFGVGLHFSLADLQRVKNIAIPGAVLQMAIATALGMAVSMFFWDWKVGPALVFGLCLSCASTVVLLKGLEMQGKLKSTDGQIAVGWLIVEDMATVMILVLLPPIAMVLGLASPNDAAQAVTEPKTLTTAGIVWIFVETLLRVAAFVVLMLVVGRKVVPWALWKVARVGSRELFTLAVLFIAVGVAFGAAAIFNVGFALGAFFAGLVLRESHFAHRVGHDALPFQDAFAVFFFVGVGMMLDWHVMFEEPWVVLSVLAIILVGKAVTAFALVHLFRYPLHTSLTVAASLAQIGEFSFILAAQGIALGMMNQQTLSLIVAAALLSIAVNPVFFRSLGWITRTLVRHFAWARRAALLAEPYAALPKTTDRRMLTDHTILVGSGEISDILIDILSNIDVPVVVVVEDNDMANRLADRQIPVIVGDPSDPMVLVQAHVVTASQLLLAELDLVKSLKTIEVAREFNADINVIVRAHSNTEAWRLRETGLSLVFSDSQSISAQLSAEVLNYYARDRQSKDEEQAKNQALSALTPRTDSPLATQEPRVDMTLDTESNSDKSTEIDETETVMESQEEVVSTEKSNVDVINEDKLTAVENIEANNKNETLVNETESLNSDAKSSAEMVNTSSLINQAIVASDNAKELLHDQAYENLQVTPCESKQDYLNRIRTGGK